MKGRKAVVKPPRTLRRAWPLRSTSVGWSVAGLLLGLSLGAVVQAPARWAADAVAEASGGHVRLLQPHGTVWNGSAILALAAGHTGSDLQMLPTRLQWRWTPDWGGVRLELSAVCCTPQPLRAQLTPSGVQLDDGVFSLPLVLLQGLGTPWNTLGLGGSLQVRTVSAQVAWPGQLQGRLQMTAQQVSTRLSTLADVGSYRLELTGGDTAQLALSTLRGDLLLSGTGSWRNGRLRFQGEGEARPESAGALVNLLTLMGEKQGQKTKIRLG